DRVRCEILRFWASIVAEPPEDDADALTGDANSAMGFFVQPGGGCEVASFCLLRRLDATGENADWFWYCFCKTQYASTVSEDHFIACHTVLVQMLDAAIACGFEVVVDDEGHYWETRDTAQLVDSMRKMNTSVAGFAGRLSDALGDAHDVRAAIFEHPRFERLEMGEEE
ncbi:MAG: hypothetical protein ABI120_06260, partial [Gemmatimonadaceae bacterium]